MLAVLLCNLHRFVPSMEAMESLMLSAEDFTQRLKCLMKIVRGKDEHPLKPAGLFR